MLIYVFREDLSSLNPWEDLQDYLPSTSAHQNLTRLTRTFNCTPLKLLGQRQSILAVGKVVFFAT